MKGTNWSGVTKRRSYETESESEHTQKAKTKKRRRLLSWGVRSWRYQPPPTTTPQCKHSFFFFFSLVNSDYPFLIIYVFIYLSFFLLLPALRASPDPSWWRPVFWDWAGWGPHIHTPAPTVIFICLLMRGVPKTR